MPRPCIPSPERVVPLLLDWFARHARELPWRLTRDPYAIWISEIMLQQTQVKTVIPYWNRWMEALPNVGALAEAREERVLKLWEGLGYYSRARNLMKTARVIVNELGGRFPDTVDGLLKLPGIGPYTAGAIASIAFNQPAPILDGNVIRVLTRLHAMPGDPKSKELNRRLWDLAERLVLTANCAAYQGRHSILAAGPCSALNQSLMELGATLCTPRNPVCNACPLHASCRALMNDEVSNFPQTATRPSVEERQLAVIVLERNGSFWLRQRPPNSVNAGFWEFPSVGLQNAGALETAAHRLSVDSQGLQPLGRLKHSITRYRIQLDVFLARAARKKLPSEWSGRWVSAAELESLHLTAAHRRIAATMIPGQLAAKRAQMFP